MLRQLSLSLPGARHTLVVVLVSQISPRVGSGLHEDATPGGGGDRQASPSPGKRRQVLLMGSQNRLAWHSSSIGSVGLWPLASVVYSQRSPCAPRRWHE